MSCLWLYLTLLYAASFVQNRASSDQAVTLKCNETVEVKAGEMATLNCTIIYIIDFCKCLSYSWNNANGSIPCSSGLMQYNCECDNDTYVSLTISNVTKKENYTANIHTDCGKATSSPIEVQVMQISGRIIKNPNSTHDGEASLIRVPAMFCGISIIFIVSGMLYILFGTNRGREIRKHIKKKPTHEATVTWTLHQGVKTH